MSNSLDAKGWTSVDPSSMEAFLQESAHARYFTDHTTPARTEKSAVHPHCRRYKDRNRIERMFGKLRRRRRIATRYDRTVFSFEGFFKLAAARLWHKSFVNAA